MKTPGIIILTSFFCYSAVAEMNALGMEFKKNRFEKKNFDASLGVVFSHLQTNDKTGLNVNGTGLNLNIGNIFNINQDWNTTTSFVGNTTSVKVVDGVKSKLYEYGLTQKISYDIAEYNIVFRPFIGIGYIRGAFSSTTNDSMSASVDLNYTKYSAVFGVQAILENNFVPYVSFEYSKINFENKLVITQTNSNNTLYVRKDVAIDNDPKGSSRSISMGLGYLF